MEVWKPYGSYEVSNLGNIRRNGRILKPSFNKGGYLQLVIHEKGIKKTMRVHRIIALCFLENPENKEFVDHINRDKTDNRVENLRWATRSENTINVSVKSNNKLGLKHIHEHRNGQHEYWVIKIHSPKICKSFNKSKYTLEQVLEERNKIYLENNINE